MSAYRHTQFGTLMFLTFGPVVLGMATLILYSPRTMPFAIPVLLLMLFVGLLFYNLTVEVTNDFIAATFGIGLIKRRIPLDIVADARVVRNKWWYGWGVRLTPHGWLWNVSGLDAVELEYTNGKRFRIGTDEPERLVEAINNARERTP
jgi:hypothetical protein